MNFSGAELLGYTASFTVLLSFFMKDMTKLRLISIVGCVLFVIYGAILSIWPVIVTNVAIVLVNTWYLWKAKK